MAISAAFTTKLQFYTGGHAYGKNEGTIIYGGGGGHRVHNDKQLYVSLHFAEKQESLKRFDLFATTSNARAD